jgi:Cu/Ag efflux pump CusA
MAFVTFLLVLASLAGGVLMAFLMNSTLSLASLLGLLAVAGIAARHAMVQINHYRHLETEKSEGVSSELVLHTAQERVTPVILSSLTTALALAPFIFSGNRPGLEIVQPMAIIIVGGLVTSTLLNLFVLPALYLRYGASREVDLELYPVPGDLPAVATD